MKVITKYSTHTFISKVSQSQLRWTVYFLPLRIWLLNKPSLRKQAAHTALVVSITIHHMVALFYIVLFPELFHIYPNRKMHWNQFWVTFGLKSAFSLEAASIHLLSGDDRRRFKVKESHTTCLETSDSAGQVKTTRDPRTDPT